MFSSAQKPHCHIVNTFYNSECIEPKTHKYSNLLQAAQTSSLTDRQGEERRILDLENTVKSVSLTDILMNLFSPYQVLIMSEIICNVTTVSLVLKGFVLLYLNVAHRVFWGVVGAGETRPAVTVVSAEGEQAGCGG